jgi:hypothetical protein
MMAVGETGVPEENRGLVKNPTDLRPDQLRQLLRQRTPDATPQSPVIISKIKETISVL